MLELGSTAGAHMPEILRALAQPLTSGKDGMQASRHPRLLANSPASLTSRDRHRHAGLGSRVFLTTKSSAVLRPGQICSQQLPLHCGSLCVGSPKTHARIPAQGTGGAVCFSAHAHRPRHGHQACANKDWHTCSQVPTCPASHAAPSSVHTHTHSCTTTSEHAQLCSQTPPVQTRQSQAHPMQTTRRPQAGRGLHTATG